MSVKLMGETDIPSRLTRGVEHELRLGHQAELITNFSGFGEWFEASKQSFVFSQLQLNLTITANHNLGLDNVSDTGILGFVNPSSSGVAAVIQETTFTSVSGTPPAGGHPVLYIARSTDSITAATTGTIIATDGSGTSSKMRSVANVALAGLNTTYSNNAVAIAGGAVFAGAVAANHDAEFRVNYSGKIIVPPGAGFFMLAGTAAGTTWVVSASATWAELPWPQ